MRIGLYLFAVLVILAALFAALRMKAIVEDSEEFNERAAVTYELVKLAARTRELNVETALMLRAIRNCQIRRYEIMSDGFIRVWQQSPTPDPLEYQEYYRRWAPLPGIPRPGDHRSPLQKRDHPERARSQSD